MISGFGDSGTGAAPGLVGVTGVGVPLFGVESGIELVFGSVAGAEAGVGAAAGAGAAGAVTLMFFSF